MIPKSSWLIGIGLLGIAATASASEWIGPDGSTSDKHRAQRLERLLEQNPLNPGENIKVIDLAQTEHSKHILVQVRDREPLHYHADSDIAVFVLRGEGEIRLNEETFPVRAGDVLHIARGVIHAFINRGSQPAAALVVYSPPPGPDDRVLVKDLKRKN